MNVPIKRLYTYFAFSYNGQKYEAKFLKQKFEVNNTTYVLDDIYGIANSDISVSTNNSNE